MNEGFINLIHPVSDAEFRALNERTCQLHIICLVPRKGGAEFFKSLEFTHYAPGTPANDQLDMCFHLWGGMTWCIASVPLRDRAKVEDICRRHTMRLVDGYPVMVADDSAGRVVGVGATRVERFKDKSKIIDTFPLTSRRTFTLEQDYGPGAKGPIVTGIHATSTAKEFWSAIEEAADAAWRDILKDRASRN